MLPQQQPTRHQSRSSRMSNSLRRAVEAEVKSYTSNSTSRSHFHSSRRNSSPMVLLVPYSTQTGQPSHLPLLIREMPLRRAQGKQKTFCASISSPQNLRLKASQIMNTTH